MTTTTTAITVKRYKTPDGKPTCARDFSTGEVCEFLLSKHFGTRFLCSFDLEGRIWHGAKGVFNNM